MDLYCSSESDLKHKLNDECVREIFTLKGMEFEKKFLEDTDSCMVERYAAKEVQIEEELKDEVEKRFKDRLDKELGPDWKSGGAVMSELEKAIELLNEKRTNLINEMKRDEDEEDNDEDDDDPEGIWKD